MILLIDNYDSFVYNLARYVRELGEEPVVRRHDAMTVEEILSLAPSHIIISPGPCSPAEAGISTEVVRRVGPHIPILGVCLGHQCIVEVYGGVVERARRLMHGKVGTVDRIEPDDLLDGLPECFEAGRYHSLAAIEPLPEVLIATARDRDGEVMALRHRDIPHLHGVQFHPESVLTPAGDVIARNFLAMGRAS